MDATRKPPVDGEGDAGIVKDLVEQLVTALTLSNENALDTCRTMMDEFVQGRPNATPTPLQAWPKILNDERQMIEADYLLLRQGLGRQGRNRLDLSRNADGGWELTGDRIVDAIGLAIGTPDGNGQMVWDVVPIDHVRDRCWAIDRTIFEGGLVTFATFDEDQATSAWQGLLVPSHYEDASAS